MYYPNADDLGSFINFKAAAYLNHTNPRDLFESAPGFLKKESLKMAFASELEALTPEIIQAYRPSLAPYSAFIRMHEDEGGFLKIPASTRIVANSACAVGTGMSFGAWSPVSKLALSAASLTPRVAACLMVLSDELAGKISSKNSRFITNESRKGLGAGLDACLFSETITSDTPSFALSTSTPPDVLAGVHDLLSVVATRGAGGYYFVCSPDAANYLATQGALPFAGVTPLGGELLGLPLLVSDQLGSGELVLIDAQRIAADFQNIEVDFSRNASLQMDSAPTDASAELVSMFQSGCVAVRARATFGFEVVEDGAIAVLTGVSGGMR